MRSGNVGLVITVSSDHFLPTFSKENFFKKGALLNNTMSLLSIVRTKEFYGSFKVEILYPRCSHNTSE